MTFMIEVVTKNIGRLFVAGMWFVLVISLACVRVWFGYFVAGHWLTGVSVPIGRDSLHAELSMLLAVC